MSQSLTINIERLKKDLRDLALIGQDEDHGIYRMEFTKANMEARSWLLGRIKQAGLDPYQDGAANIFGRIHWTPSTPSLMLGSHIDTVPAAGHLDGALGVLAALECLRRIKEEKIKTRLPLEMVAFTDEEGRFGGLFGSEAVAGRLNPGRIQSATDLNGVLLTDAMKTWGLNADEALEAQRPKDSIYGYLEMHIEQGPVLDHLGLQVGIVEEITGLFHWVARLIGSADHAGTTPMPMRKDAFAGLAEFASQIPQILSEYGSDRSVATVGKVTLHPGTANTVPSRAEFALDVRDTNSDSLDNLAEAFRKTLSSIARKRGLMFEFDVMSEISPVPCSPDFCTLLSETAETMGIQAHQMPSGAAHDAQIMTGITRVGMIFVPSKDGKSHSPAEWTAWEDIECGANLLLNTVLRIARKE